MNSHTWSEVVVVTVLMSLLTFGLIADNCHGPLGRSSLRNSRALSWPRSTARIFLRATPFRCRLKRDQRARSNFHLAWAFALLLQLVIEPLGDPVCVAELQNGERQARWRHRCVDYRLAFPG